MMFVWLQQAVSQSTIVAVSPCVLLRISPDDFASVLYPLRKRISFAPARCRTTLQMLPQSR